jgi:photosystem II stability/assembly factor-like uncharacterized protein
VLLKNILKLFLISNFRIQKSEIRNQKSEISNLFLYLVKYPLLMKTIAGLILFFLMICPVIVTSQWTYLNPRPQANRLNDITFTDPQHGIIVGSYGTILMTDDGGKNWAVTGMDSTLNMTCIFYAGNSMVYVSTDNGLILKSYDSGDSWEIMDPGFHIRINSIWFTSEDTGYAAGPAWIMKTADAGDSWTRQAFDPYDEFYSVFFTTPDSGFIAGRGSKIFRTTDAGATWLESYSGSDYDIYSLFFVNSMNGYTCGGYPTLHTTDGGVTWYQIYPESRFMDDNDIYFLDADTGFIVNDYGGIRRTTDGGLSWDGYYDLYASTNAIFFTDNRNGFVVGDYGLIYYTNDAGSYWRSLTTVETHPFDNAFFLDKDTGFVMSFYSRLFKTIDGGDSWTRLKTDEFHDPYYEIVFTDNKTGFIPGENDGIMKTTDGGMSWNYIYTGFDEANSSYSSLCFPSKDTAYIMGHNHVLRSIDAGDTWAEVLIYEPLGYGDMRFFDNNTGVLKYYRDIFHTYDAGQTWEHTTDTAPYGEAYFLNADTGYTLADYGSLQRTLNGGLTWNSIANFPEYGSDVKFIDYYNGYVCGPYGALYKTTDAGQSWTKQVTGTDNDFWFIYMIDTSTVFAGGEGGMILKYESDNLVNTQELLPEKNAISAYPNPFTEDVTIGFYVENPGKAVISVYDLAGKIVHAKSMIYLTPGPKSLNINGNDLPPGIYILTINTGEKQESVKIVKGTEF